LCIVPLYDDFKWRWKQSFPEANNAVVHMGSAVSAGAIADILCNPMFVVRTRLQTEAVHNLARQVSNPSNSGEVFQSSSIIQTIQQLYAEGGLRTFWRGMSANLLGLTHVAVQFPVYEQLKYTLRQRRRRHLHESGNHTNAAAATETVLDLLLASGLSKIAASLLTYPHETIRSRMMDARTAHAVSFVGTCRSIYRAEGILGFYAGLSISLIRVIPNTMLTFLVYETTLRLVQNKLLPEDVSK
jgi:solute carrier family 25 (mitochondrial folate transporter), member 32